MATVNPDITDPDLRAMMGLPPIGSDPLEAFLEQALDPIKRQGFDITPYMQGVNTNPYGITNQQAIDENIAAANTVLSRIAAAQPDVLRGGSFTPWQSFADFNTRQNTREGFNEGSDLGSFLSGGVEHLGDTASELWAEPGVKALIGAGTAGAFMGPGAAATTGTAAADTGLAGLIESGSVGTAGGAMEAGALTGGLDYASFLGPTAATGTGGAASTAAGSSVLSRIMAGNATPADWLNVAGTVGVTGLGVYGADKQSDALAGIAAQSRADRAPFLGKANEWLTNPSAYIEGPGAASMDATLKRLSAERGNPIDSPTALALATQAGMQDWRNAVTGFANIGLSGEDSRNSLMANAAGADAEGLNALGYGIGELTKPKKLTLADVLGRQYGLT